MNKTKIFMIALAAALVSLAGAGRHTLAHGDDMTTQSADDGKYHIEFEYDSTGPVYDRQEFNYTFRLEDKSTGNETNFNRVSIEFIRPQFGISGTANLQPLDKGAATFGLTLPSPDTYTVNAVFYDSSGTKLAQASFTLDVKPNQAFAAKNPGWKKYFSAQSLLVGIIIGLLGALLIWKIKSAKKDSAAG